MKNGLFTLSTLLLVMLFSVPASLAQGTLFGPGMGTGGSPGSLGMPVGEMSVDLAGSVSDKYGRPLPDVRINVQNVNNGRVIAFGMTRPDGSYEILNVPQGEYIVAALAGLHEEQRRVQLLGMGNRVDFRLPVIAESYAVGKDATVSVAQLKVPKKARKLLKEAQEAVGDNERDEAIRYTDEALEEFPDYSEALTLRAILHMEDNQGDQARTLLEKAVKADPNYGMAYVALGAAYNMLTRFDDALRVLGRAFRFTPKSWQGYYESARAHLGKQEFEKALQQIDKAANYAPPEFTAIHLVRAQALLGLRQYPRAIVDLEAYLKKDSDGGLVPQAQKMLDYALRMAERAALEVEEVK